MHHIEAATRFAPLEVWEQKNPWLMERCELAVDSGGPGKHQGGLGPDLAFHVLEDALSSSPSEPDPEAVRSDLHEGYVSEDAARRDYPHAFDS